MNPRSDCHPVILSYFNKHVDESTILRLNDDSNEYSMKNEKWIFLEFQKWNMKNDIHKLELVIHHIIYKYIIKLKL